ncbi:hypothetical protein HPB47_017493 [Ixodes persulcatus]|uniref:Uncharacterized protein n=2 Tax=Ixodes persulcatus TaxID=34615 RepID=A0AC60PWF4_IXOPE|nr:hypothetical protein HPB47_027738 [Ixodes persulcatus]KAG0437319.1 hypothetical protein HPB47_017493 [Ixodes persulcatus]
MLVCTLLAASAALLVSLLVFLAVVCGVIAATALFVIFIIAPLILGSSAIALLAVFALLMMFFDISALPFMNSADTEGQVDVKMMENADIDPVVKAEKGVKCQCICVQELIGLDDLKAD